MQGRRVLLLTLLVFLLPIIVGGALYLSGWRPATTANHGTLIVPPKPAPVASLGGDTAGKWLLVIAGDGPCTEECAALAGRTRAIQVSLNKEMLRVRRILFADAGGDALEALRTQQPDLVVREPDTAWRTLLDAGPRHRLFVVDPAGNLMMQYSPDADAKDVRADLERLLKFSWIG